MAGCGGLKAKVIDKVTDELLVHQCMIQSINE
jgi:hypothetical protein